VISDRPLRADARRNRAKVLKAAGAVFARDGLSVSTEEIAKAAGVGVGTVFRHFPTKESLLSAVFMDLLRGLAEQAEELTAAEDPGAAFFTFLNRVAGSAETKISLANALAEVGVDVRDATEDAAGALRGAMAVLLRRAQRAGSVRADVGVPELIAVLVGASRAAEYVVGDDALRSRSVAIVLDGLRPTR